MAKRMWLVKDKRPKALWCCSGPPYNCENLRLLQAEESHLHDRALIRATDRINAILDEVRQQAPDGHHLALIDTTMGLLLVWAEAMERPDDLRPYVSSESPPEQIRRALGLQVDELQAASS